MNQFGQNNFAVNRALELSRKIEVADSFETLIIYAEEARRIDESFLGAGPFYEPQGPPSVWTDWVRLRLLRGIPL